MKNQNNNYSYCFRAEEYVHTQSKYNLQFVYFFKFFVDKITFYKLQEFTC